MSDDCTRAFRGGQFAAAPPPVYAGSVLLPEARAARLRAHAAPAGDLAPLEFSRLHRRVVAVNISLFTVGVVAFVLHAAARPRLR